MEAYYYVQVRDGDERSVAVREAQRLIMTDDIHARMTSLIAHKACPPSVCCAVDAIRLTGSPLHDTATRRECLVIVATTTNNEEQAALGLLLGRMNDE